MLRNRHPIYPKLLIEGKMPFFLLITDHNNSLLFFSAKWMCLCSEIFSWTSVSSFCLSSFKGDRSIEEVRSQKCYHNLCSGKRCKLTFNEWPHYCLAYIQEIPCRDFIFALSSLFGVGIVYYFKVCTLVWLIKMFQSKTITNLRDISLPKL